MKITLSRAQWESIGKKTGWIKEAKWNEKTEVSESEKGKWTNYSIKELISKRDHAKQQQETYKSKHDGKADPDLTSKLRELNFAIRAKRSKGGSWGKAE